MYFVYMDQSFLMPHIGVPQMRPAVALRFCLMPYIDLRLAVTYGFSYTAADLTTHTVRYTRYDMAGAYACNVGHTQRYTGHDIYICLFGLVRIVACGLRVHVLLMSVIHTVTPGTIYIYIHTPLPWCRKLPCGLWVRMHGRVQRNRPTQTTLPELEARESVLEGQAKSAQGNKQTGTRARQGHVSAYC